MFKVVFQQIFLKLQSGGLEETILEIIQVPQNAAAVEFRQWVAIAEIHVLASLELYRWKETDGLFQHHFFFGTEAAAFAAFLDKLEQGSISQVVLQVSRLVGCLGKHTGNGQTFL